MLDKNTIEIFSSRDKIRSSIIDLAKDYLKLEGFDFNQTSYLSYLIDTLSILTANLMYYNSSVYREMFLTKALQRESVLNLSKMIGYSSPLAKPATCSVLLSIPISRFKSTQTVSMQLIGRSNIPTELTQDLRSQVFKVYAGNTIFALKDTVNINYVKGSWRVSQQVILDDGNGNLNPNGWTTIQTRESNGFLEFYLNFIQLEDVTEVFTIPLLQPYEFHNLKFIFKKPGFLSDLGVFFVSTSSNEVLEEWVRKDSIFLLSPNEAAYSFRELDSGVVISFGNGIIGKQPQNNSSCVITAGITQGFSGNVISGSIRKADSVYYQYGDGTTESSPRSTMEIKVVNKEPAQGGQDPPSVDEIRSNSIKSVSTNNRLVSLYDFENAETVVPDLPIQNVFQVLKRSDLKRNEITLFTDIVYDNIIVPTKNLYITNINFSTEDNEIQYKAGTILNEDPTDDDSEEYLTLFDIVINKSTKECDYFYYLDEIDIPVTLVGTKSDPYNISTPILPIFTHIFTDRTSDPELLNVELHTNVLDTSQNYSCELTIPLISKDYPSTVILNKKIVPNSNSTSYIFTTEPIFDTSGNTIHPKVIIPLEFVEDGNTNLNFKLSYIDTSSGVEYYNLSKVEAVIKRNLSDFMYSQVVETSSDGRDGAHSADTDKDYKISADELNRVIDLYNAGRYHNDSSSIDGFAPGTGNEEDNYHDADIDRDWVISLDELQRVIQFFNSGGYHTDATSEDGFAVGPPETVYDRVFSVYDIPCINKKYYESIADKSLFTKQILQKIISFDVYSYKMLTDYVNLKFANTYGKSRNMKYNYPSAAKVKDINPATIPSSPVDGERYAVSEDKNAWKDYYNTNSDSSSIFNISSYNKDGGFIAEYFEEKVINDTTQTNGWLFESLKVNDIIEVSHLYGDTSSKIVIYNGSDFVEPVFDIPFKINLIVFTNPSITSSDTTLREKISTALIDGLAPKFGYQKSIYLSEIMKIVQGVQGVRNCTILEPKHDIFFDFDPQKLSQDELIRFTPELIYFGSNNISIDVRSTSSY